MSLDPLLIQRAEKAIQHHRLLLDEESVLLAISGGADSMVMLDVLAKLSGQHGWQLKVAHFNHQLRGRASDLDEALVRQAAKKYGLPFFGKRGDVAGFAIKSKISVEMAARELRHRFFAETAVRQKIKKIALAHHGDDQLELFFIRLFRGAGSDGLSGMQWKSFSPQNRAIEIIRPLLGEQRHEIVAFAKAEKIPYREDKTNRDKSIPRNRIREELLPLLRKHYQPGLGPVIFRQMEILEAESGFLESCARAWLEDPSQTTYSLLPLAVQRRVLVLQFQCLGVSAEFDWIEKLRENPGKALQVDSARRLLLEANGMIIVLNHDRPEFEGASRQVLLEGKGGSIGLIGLKIDWKRQKASGGTNRAQEKSMSLEQFDAESVGNRIVLRRWQRGDRFQPIGMSKPVKLQDFFSNNKVPRNQRHQLWLGVAESGEIFWVEGMRIGENFKLKDHSKYQLKWTWKRLS